MKEIKNQDSKPAPLSKVEIIFDKAGVPDEKIKTCYLWEYARESSFIRSIRERCRQISRTSMKREDRDAFVGKEFYKFFHDLGRSSILFQEGFYALGGTSGHATTSPFPEPWQSLSPEMRGILQETTAWTPDMLMKLMPFRWAHPARAMVLAKDLEKAFAQRKQAKGTNLLTIISNLNPAEAKKEADEFLGGDKPRSERPSWMYPNGHETLAVEIEWGRFNNDEIIAGFQKWVKVHRPKHIKAPIDNCKTA